MINNVNEAIIKDALSPVKKIKIKVEKKINKFKTVIFKFFLKKIIKAIKRGSNLDKKLPRIRSSLKKPEILSNLYFLNFPVKYI